MAQVPSVNFGMNQTQNTINNISNTWVWTQWRTQTQFFNDVKKVMNDWTFWTQEEAIKWVLEYAKSRWVQYEWIDSDEIIGSVKKKREDISILQRFWDTFKKRGRQWAWILRRWVEWETSALEWGLLMWANFLWTLSDLTWDVIAEAFTELDQFWDEWSMQDALEEWIRELAQTKWWEWAFSKLQEAQKNLEDLKELDPVKWARFQWLLDTTMWVLDVAWLSAAWTLAKTWVSGTKKWLTSAFEKWTQIWKDIIKQTWDLTKRVKDERLLWKLDVKTEKWLINWKEVDIPVKRAGVTEKITKPFREADTKVLAWRALSPRLTGKNAKQKLNAIKNAEENIKSFYNAVRTWFLKWNIDTIEDAAQTVVSNLDEVWERIGKAVSQTDWTIDFDAKLIKEMTEATTAKWAKTSPATPIIKNLLDDLTDPRLSNADAFDLKKIYANEVSKLYKSGDMWTKQAKALSNAVDFLNTKVDDAVTSLLWKEFATDKKTFAMLKKIVDDLVNSAWIEWRRAPNTLAEQIWFIEWLFSPIQSTKNLFIREIAELNTRGWAWKELIKIYDKAAISAAKSTADKATLAKWVLKEIKDIPVTQKVKLTNAIVNKLDIAADKIWQAKKIIKDFITKHWEEFKNKLWDLFDELADVVWARTKLIADTWKNATGLNKAGAASSAKGTVPKAISSKRASLSDDVFDLLWKPVDMVFDLVDDFINIGSKWWSKWAAIWWVWTSRIPKNFKATPSSSWWGSVSSSSSRWATSTIKKKNLLSEKDKIELQRELDRALEISEKSKTIQSTTPRPRSATEKND